MLDIIFHWFDTILIPLMSFILMTQEAQLHNHRPWPSGSLPSINSAISKVPGRRFLQEVDKEVSTVGYSCLRFEWGCYMQEGEPDARLMTDQRSNMDSGHQMRALADWMGHWKMSNHTDSFMDFWGLKTLPWLEWNFEAYRDRLVLWIVVKVKECDDFHSLSLFLRMLAFQPPRW